MPKPSPKMLWDAVQEVDWKNSDKRIAKIVASVSALIDAGADIDALVKSDGDSWGWPGAFRSKGSTALFQAANGGHSAVVALLLERGANPNLGRGLHNEGPLHCAAERGNAEIVRALLLAGANPKLRDNREKTPMDWAKRANVKQLLKGGAALKKPAPPPAKRSPPPPRLVTFLRDKAKKYAGRSLTRVPGYEKAVALKVKFLKKPSDKLLEETDTDLVAFPHHHPLAELVDEPQFLVVDGSKAALPVLLWEHETCDFRPVAKSLDALLKRLK